jgi:hypothetical protein
MTSWFCNYSQYDNLLGFWEKYHIIFKILFISWLVSCKNHPPLQLITIQSPMMTTWHIICQQDDVILFVNIMIHVIDLMN